MTPTYRGRPLPRPDEEVVDQGLGFDVATLLGRRRLLRALGLGAVTVGLAACGSGATSTAGATAGTTAGATAAGTALAEIPDETAGPYPGDGSNGVNVLTESGVVRSDIRSSFGDASGTAEGVPMTLELTVRDLANGGVPFVGRAVYVWHCNRDGEYSLYSDAVADQNYLRGVQVTDDAGVVRFTSIFPACYAGRWPHVHFEVYPDQDGITDAANAVATSQVALPEDACDAVYATAGYAQSVTNLAGITLQSDNVFGDDGGATQLGTVTGDVTAGYAVALQVGVDTTTAPTGGQAPSGSDGAPAGAPSGAPPGPPPSGARPTGTPGR
jgi:protocatechuate 3,4-dioxygenase beta subunit